jgi:hypothetical protein
MALNHAVVLATQLLTGQVLNVAPPASESPATLPNLV